MALFKQIFANDPNNPQNVAENGVISIFAPGTRDLVPIRTVTGGPLSNPLQLNSRGFGPAFDAPGYTQVAWEAIAPGEVFQGTFESYEGVLEEAVAAKVEAAAGAAAELAQRVEAGEFKGADGQDGKDGSNVVPTEEAIAAAIGTPGAPANTVLSATIAGEVAPKLDKGKAPQAVERAKRDRGLKTWDAHLAYEATPRLHIAGHSVVAGSSSDGEAFRFTTIMSTRLAAWRNVSTTVNGNSGWTSTQILNSAPNLSVKTGCVVLMCMLNDYMMNIPSATTKANLLALIGLYRAAPQPAPGPSIVIVGEWLRTDVTNPAEPWNNYLAAAKEVAEADNNAIYVDLRERLGSVADDPADMNLFTGDGVHPGQRGHAYIADALLAELQRGRMFSSASSSAAVYPRQLAIDCSTVPELSSGTMSAPIKTGDANGWVRETDGAQGFTVEWTLPMAAGGYSLDLFHRLGPDRGRYWLDIDGAQQGSTPKGDGYAATASDSRERSATYTITTSGDHKIRLRMADKNAASSGYKGSLARMVWTKVS